MTQPTAPDRSSTPDDPFGDEPLAGDERAIERAKPAQIVQAEPEDDGGGLVTVERSATALAQRARTEVEAAYELALKYPRNLDETRTRLIRACKDHRFAEKATYKIKRGGKDITGPSIRFAEECLRLYRNVRSSRRVVYDDRRSRVVQVSVLDLETNTLIEQEVEIEKVVERKFVKEGDVVISSRTNSEGATTYLIEAGLDDLRMKEGAEVARVRRNLVLELFPSWIRREAEEEVARTLKAGFKDDPQAATRRVLDGLAERGIPASQVTEYLGRPEAGQLSNAEYDELRGALVSIIEGTATWGEILEAKKGSTGQEKRPEATAEVARLRARGAAARQQPAASPAATSDTRQAAWSGQPVAPSPAAAPADGSTPSPASTPAVPRDNPKAEAGSFAREPAPPPAAPEPPAGDPFNDAPPPAEPPPPPPPSDDEAIAGFKGLLEQVVKLPQAQAEQALEDMRQTLKRDYPEGGVVRTTIGPLWTSAKATIQRGDVKPPPSSRRRGAR